MLDLDGLDHHELRALLEQARAELERRESAPVDEEVAIKSLQLELKRHRRRRDEPFDPFA
ncbi:MAG: hypothetical protein ACOC02_03265 [Guyparkeria sp.]|uniref:hypothetical protein n=1 Tax=Guyparkeria sp. TaxID=2035736 RepID=UPI00397B4DDC